MGANLIFDKQAVVFASPQAAQAFDITQAAVDQLNQKLPSSPGRAGRAAEKTQGGGSALVKVRMAYPRFYRNRGPFTLAEICAQAGAELPAGADNAAQVGEDLVGLYVMPGAILIFSPAAGRDRAEASATKAVLFLSGGGKGLAGGITCNAAQGRFRAPRLCRCGETCFMPDAVQISV